MSKKRRKYSPQFKLETVLESMRSEKSKAQICRERNITDSLLYRWEQEFMDKAPSIFNNSRQSAEATTEQVAQVAELERMVGRLTMELEVLKKSTSWLGSQRRKNER